jgi:hypothetical protein
MQGCHCTGRQCESRRTLPGIRGIGRKLGFFCRLLDVTRKTPPAVQSTIDILSNTVRRCLAEC